MSDTPSAHDPSQAAQALANYRQLIAKVDGKFAEIKARHPQAMHCAQGCHSCCKSGLTVGVLEAAAIRSWLAHHPEAKDHVARLTRTLPHQGQRCALLSEDGSCSIYEARPIICRSHGAPISFQQAKVQVRDVCPLNFGGDVSELAPQDLLNIDTLNTLLALITSQFGGTTERVSLEQLVTDL